jgi:O-antigen/teichoic acid export membrane protein
MSKLIQKAARGTLWHGISQVVQAVSGYLVAVILARGLGPANFGVYGLIYSFLMAVELITILGIPGAVSRLTAEGRDQNGSLRATGLGLVAFLCLIAFAILWLLAPSLSVWLGVPNSAGLIRIAILDVPCFGVYFLISHILNGRRDFAGQSVGITLYALTKVVGTAALTVIGLSISGALIVNVMTSLVGLLYVSFRAGKPSFNFKFAAAPPILRLAAPVAWIALGTQLLLNMDLWFLGHAGADIGAKTGGYYVAAKNLARIPNLIAFVMNSVLIPSIAHAMAAGDSDQARRIMRGSMRFLALTLLPGCALMAIEAGPLMSLLFHPEYSAGARYLQLLVIANGFLQTLCSTFITILVATRRQREGAIVALVAILPTLLLNAVLVHWYGSMGAALAAVLSAAIAATVAGFVTYRYTGAFIEFSTLAKILLTTTVVCVVASLLPSAGLIPLLGNLVLSAVLFLVLCAAFGVLTRDDLSLLPGRAAAKRVA